MTENSTLEFIKFRSLELNHSVVSAFCIDSYGNNMVIQNPVMETVILSLINEPDVAELFPYATVAVDIPQERPTSKLLSSINFRNIYTKSHVQEQQELALDPLYIADRSTEPTKARLVSAHYSPTSFPREKGYFNQKSMLAIVTTYGTCQILSKNYNERLWKKEAINLTTMLITTLLPSDKSVEDMKSFFELRDFINLYYCTSCAWNDTGDIIYIANAAGYLFALKNEMNSTDKFEEGINESFTFYCKIKTTMNYISYIKTFDNYLVVANAEGILHLYKLEIYDNQTSPCFRDLGRLWEHSDNMECRQILVQKCSDFNGYIVISAKASNVLLFFLSNEMKVASMHTLVDCIKITGMQLLANNELIVGTIMGNVFRLIISYQLKNSQPTLPKSRIEPVSVPQIDAANFQLLGIGTTTNRALWFLVIHRNKEPPVASKGTFLPTHVILFKPSTLNEIDYLNSIRIDSMDPFLDIILSLRLDIWHANKYDHFQRYMPLSDSSSLPECINSDELLQKLQIKYEVSQAIFRRVSFKAQIIAEDIQYEIYFLKLAIQVTHIVLCLNYFKSIIDTKGFEVLSSLQRKSAICMRRKFYLLLEEIRMEAAAPSKRDTTSKIKENSLKFVNSAQHSINATWIDKLMNEVKFSEKCLTCHESFNSGDMMCPNKHIMLRCSVSYLPVPLFGNRFCSQCHTLALKIEGENDPLVEIFPPNDSVKCTICRCTFICDQ